MNECVIKTIQYNKRNGVDRFCSMLYCNKLSYAIITNELKLGTCEQLDKY